MRAPNEFTVSSLLAAPPEEVWARVSTMRGLNAEVAPWFRMTAPRGVDSIEAREVPLGQPLFRSWLLLLGVLPVEFDLLTFVRFEPGRGFLERSPMALIKVWEHERTLEPHPEGTVLTDRILYEPRVRLPGQRSLFTALFRHRHARLRRHFGGRPL